MLRMCMSAGARGGLCPHCPSPLMCPLRCCTLGCSALQVLILDWDVHHGNGTEDIFYDSDAVLYISTHQQGLWPYTGRWTAAGQLE